MANAIYQLISENPLHLIYKKNDAQGGTTTIVKRINSPFPSDILIAQLKNEYESAKKLNIPGFRKSISFSEAEGSYSLELEYVEGRTIDDLASQNILSMKDVLFILIQICDILNDIHKEGYIHGSLNGSNILVDTTTLQPTIIDSSLMSRFKLKVNYKFNIEYTKGVLPYISPEQTGRTSKVLDQRTDFYSLGVMAYETLVGHLPFISEEPLDVIYSHLSRVPKSPSSINPEIPPVLSKVISKLLAKNAEDRYQSALGLKWDLNKIITNWEKRKDLSFPIGERDFTGRLIIPQKLYGRAEIISELNSLVENISKGDQKTVFIYGESGTGKSAVVQEIRKPITKSKGYYLEGKFDQLDRNIPYSAWIGIFDDFIQQILASGEKNIQKWVQLLRDALGNKIDVLHKLIPSLGFLIDIDSVANESNSAESQNRLNDLLTKFFRSITSKEHPIVIFIDDLQWADNASINLFKKLSTDEDCRYLMLIGAYRSEEITLGSHLNIQIKELEQAGIELTKIELLNLKIDHLNEMLIETLGSDEDKVLQISEIIFEKTQGNPYFISQFLESLYDEGLITFNSVKSLEAKKPVWEWDQTLIKTKYISLNVVELLVKKISEIPVDIIEILKSAACIGNNFRLIALCTVRKKTPGQLFSLLENAVNQNYIYYKDVNQVHGIASGKDVDYQFAHDKVQQAFYSLILQSEKRSTHYELGRLISNTLSEEELKSKVFEVVFHLNFGRELIKGPDELQDLAALNYLAGMEAKKISAFDSAYEYLSFGINLVEDFIWNVDPTFAINLGTEYLDSLYLTNRFDEGEKYFSELVSRIPSNIGKAEIYYRKMILYQHLSKIDNILDLGLEGLELLGMKFNPDMNRATLIGELVKTASLLRGKSELHLSELPIMTDQRMRIAMSLIYKIQVFAYDRNENLMGVLSMRLIQLTVKYGVHDYSMSGFTAYGGLLAVGFQNYDAALKYNRLALTSSARFSNRGAQAMAHFGMGMIGFTALDHKESIQQFRTSVDLAMEAGAHSDAAPGTMYLFALNFLRGMRLTSLRQIVIDNLYLTAKIKTENFHLFLLAGLSVIDELKVGRKKPVESIRAEQYTYEEIEKSLSETEHVSIRTYSQIFQMLNHVLFDRLDQAKHLEEQILTSFNVTRGSVFGLFFRYLQILLYSKVYESAEPSSKGGSAKKIRKAVKMISSIAKHNPKNYSHWELFGKAEIAKIDNKNSLAQTLYDSAIDKAQQENYVSDMAIFTYYCALFNKKVGHAKIANYYYDSAALAFKTWGADHLSKFVSQKSESVSNTALGQNDQSFSLDQKSLFKLSQLISGEIDIDQLIKKLMNVFSENAGAERAILILKHKKDWLIEAEHRKDEEVEIQSERISEKYLSKSVCEYVIRTRKTVIIDEAKTDERFGKTNYIINSKPRSILCMPLIKKGELTGLVYLENNITSGVFHIDRIRMLSHISSQIAVSLDNAMLYSKMRELNQAYERFVPREFLAILGKKSITEVKLGDQVQMNMSVLFADIRGFTSISEQMEPSEIFSFINEFLSRMTPIIARYNGFVDKYIGDEIMALFPESADDAVQCGIAMLHELKVFSDSLAVKNIPAVNMGIGVNTGKLMLGTVGVDNRMNSTVISDTVNIASRVEKDTKETGAAFMITKETHDHLNNPEKYGMRKLRSITYRGKSTRTNILEVFEGEGQVSKRLKKETLSDFENGVALFELQDYKQSLHHLQLVLSKNPDDIPSKNLIDQITQIST